MSAALGRIAEGAAIRIVEGPDDLCAALVDGCGHEGHCRDSRTFQRDALALEAVAPLLPAAKPEPFQLTAARLAALRRGFADGSLRAACAECEWKPLCDGIAEGGFVESRLHRAGAAPSVAD